MWGKRRKDRKIKGRMEQKIKSYECKTLKSHVACFTTSIQRTFVSLWTCTTCQSPLPSPLCATLHAHGINTGRMKKIGINHSEDRESGQSLLSPSRTARLMVLYEGRCEIYLEQTAGQVSLLLGDLVMNVHDAITATSACWPPPITTRPWVTPSWCCPVRIHPMSILPLW